jgi:hypothetical protein
MHARQLQRTFAIATLLLGLAGARPAWALPPQGEQHPRLLFDAAGRPSLIAAIAGDARRAEVWQATLAAAESLVTVPPESLLLADGYWGYQDVEELCLVAQLAEPPLNAQAAAAIEAALAWLAANTDPEVDAGLGVLGPALRLHDLVWGYDCAFSAASEAERQAIVDEILAYLAAITTDEDYYVFLFNPLLSNKSVTLGAQLVLASLLLEADLPGEPLLATAQAMGEALLAKAWRELFGADGSYREGVTYACWAMRTLLPTWEAQRRLEGAAGTEAARAERLLEWLAYQMLPAGGGAYLNRNEANTTDYIVARHHSLLEWATSHGPQPEFARWLLARSSGALGHDFGHDSDPVATLLWHASGPAFAPDFLPAGRHFPDGGLYVHHLGWPGGDPAASFLLTLEGSRFVGGHVQEDVGQFTLRALGHGFALDNGAGVAAKQTQAHNLPTADGLGQHNAGASIGTDGALSAWIQSPFLSAMSVDMAAAYSTHSPFNDPDVPWVGWDWSWGYDGGNPMQRATRTLLLFPGDAAAGELPELFLRDDLIKDDAATHAWRWRLHFEEGLTLGEIGGGEWRVSGANGLLRLFLHDPPRAGLGTSVAGFDNGNTEPNTQLFTVSQPTDHFHFLWQLTPVPNGGALPTSSTERYAEGLRLLSSRGSRERRILVSTGTVPLAIPGTDERLEGAGAWGVIEEDGRTLRTALVQGKRLHGEGRLLIGLEPAGTAAWDGAILWLSAPELVFKAYAPGLFTVIAGEQQVGFERHGDFVTSVGHPDYQQPDFEDGLPALRLEGPAAGRAPLRFTIEGADTLAGAALRGEGRAQLDVYDVQGRRVQRLALDLGAGEAVWDGRDATGAPVPAGVYFLRLRSAEASAQRKVVLLR